MRMDGSQKGPKSGVISEMCTEFYHMFRQSVADSWLVRISLVISAVIILCYLWTAGLYNILTTGGFGPHGACLLWLPDLIALYVGSDTLIGLAYVSISATLIYLVYATRRTIPFHWVFVAFGIFIIACGATHFLDVLTLWWPVYWSLGIVKLLTALASVTTALALPPLVPKVLMLINLAYLSQERKQQLEQAHSELEVLYKRSQELDQLKTAFFANVSHELRTPLTLILGPVQTLQASRQLSEEQHHALEVVQRNALTLLKHVNDLLSLSRLEMGQMALYTTETDLVGILRASAAHFETLAEERHLTFIVESPEYISACLDAEKLKCICLNLLSNAFKFTPDSGIIRCTLVQEGGRALLTVQDNGPGVRPELREAIFQRFWQGENAVTQRFGGTGLGLAIVKEFVELHGGTISVSDAPEGGALFAVELPLGKPLSNPLQLLQPVLAVVDEQSFILPLLSQKVDQEADKEQASTPVSMGESPQPLVLVVEDHQDMAYFLVDILAPEYRVVVASDGQEGLDKAFILQPDLIICDVMMPRMNGERFVEQIRLSPTLDFIPIMMLSARTDNMLRVHLLREGIQEYLVKPFFPEELRVRAANLIALKQTRQVLQREVETQNQSLVLLAKEVASRKHENQEMLDALQHVNQQLIRASQVQRNFVAIVSHEFRTTLSSIQGFSELMRDEEFSPEEIKEYASDINVEARRLSRLITDLLDLERMEAGQMQLSLECLDLNSLIKEAINLLRPTAPGYIFRFCLDHTLALCKGDRDKLTQVVTNLVNNAIKYSPCRGEILIGSKAEGEMAHVWVQDHGIGIPQEALAQIFDPYCRIEAETTRYIKGTGLGLSIVRQIVQMHEGHVWVESSPGHGSCFHFTIPLAVTE